MDSETNHDNPHFEDIPIAEDDSHFEESDTTVLPSTYIKLDSDDLVKERIDGNDRMKHMAAVMMDLIAQGNDAGQVGMLIGLF
jgi:hypothetical protein